MCFLVICFGRVSGALRAAPGYKLYMSGSPGPYISDFRCPWAENHRFLRRPSPSWSKLGPGRHFWAFWILGTWAALGRFLASLGGCLAARILRSFNIVHGLQQMPNWPIWRLHCVEMRDRLCRRLHTVRRGTLFRYARRRERVGLYRMFRRKMECRKGHEIRFCLHRLWQRQVQSCQRIQLRGCLQGLSDRYVFACYSEDIHH